MHPVARDDVEVGFGDRELDVGVLPPEQIRRPAAVDGDAVTAVVDGRAHRFANIFAGSLLFSGDSARWACLATDDQARVWLVVDGRKRRRVDVVELVELAVGSPVDAALDAGDLVRPLVAAELDSML